MVGNNSSSFIAALVGVIAAMVYTATGNIVASFAFVNTASVIIGTAGLLIMFSCSKCQIVMMYSRFVSTTPILILIIVVVVVVTSTANSSLTIIRGIVVVVVVVKEVVVVVFVCFSCGTFSYWIVFFSFLKMICFFYLIALSCLILKVDKGA